MKRPIKKMARFFFSFARGAAMPSRCDPPRPDGGSLFVVVVMSWFVHYREDGRRRLYYNAIQRVQVISVFYVTCFHGYYNRRTYCVFVICTFFRCSV